VVGPGVVIVVPGAGSVIVDTGAVSVTVVGLQVEAVSESVIMVVLGAGHTLVVCEVSSVFVIVALAVVTLEDADLVKELAVSKLIVDKGVKVL
jgi:hypothetical protein